MYRNALPHEMTMARTRGTVHDRTTTKRTGDRPDVPMWAPSGHVLLPCRTGLRGRGLSAPSSWMKLDDGSSGLEGGTAPGSTVPSGGTCLDGDGDGATEGEKVAKYDISAGLSDKDLLQGGLCQVPISAVTGFMAESTMEKMMRDDTPMLTMANRMKMQLITEL